LTLALRNLSEIIPQLLHGDAISYVVQREENPADEDKHWD